MKKQFGLLGSCMIIFFTFFTGCKKQQEQRSGYIIKGEIMDPMNVSSTAELFDLDSGKKIDSAVISGNQFSFKGKTSRPKHVKIYVGNDNVELILVNDDFNAMLGDKISPAVVRGGNLNEIVYGYTYQKEFQDNFRKMMAFYNMYKEFDRKHMKKEKDSIEILLDKSEKKVSEIHKEYQKKILEGDYPVEAKAYTLINYEVWEGKYANSESRIQLLNKFEKEFGTSEAITEVRNIYIKQTKEKEKAEAEEVANGKTFKDIEAVTANGKMVKLSDVIKKNEYTLLDFWASWCAPCRGEFPYQKQAYAKYHSKGFEIYSISIDEKRDPWLKALKQENIPWINTADLKGFDGEATKEYGISGIPATFLISKDGTILASGEELRGAGLQKQLKKIIEK